MIGLIGTTLQLQSIITAHNQWLSATRSIPCCTTSVFLLRDRLVGSDLRVDHFFSFRSTLVSTPQLNTELLNCPLNSLVNESLEFTKELPFIIAREQNRDHRLQGWLFMNAFTQRRAWTVAQQKGNSVSGSIIPAFRRCSQTGCPANGHIVTICLYRTISNSHKMRPHCTQYAVI
jgi:hypothetical protein